MNNYPAPWTLIGSGYILLYRFDTNFANEQAPDFLKEKAIPGIGSVMLVNYEAANCGPYGELLIIPGKYNYKNRKLHTINKIYVSSQDSVDNGRMNWGIPKEHANFSFEPLSDKLEKVTVT
ncbi:MAG TPA: acetoacetate decarboxylase family protein, partial [Epulopiscium sp.]|nr:acetoacetate decarboxylase family protein [Candidatus Epulonipiscium sp.]